MQDYLIVGLGLAGIAFCEKLEEEGKTFTVISDNSQKSSQVAGGLYNPVILKRFTLAWNASSQMEISLPIYAKLEQKLQQTLDFKTPILRRFTSIEEQNQWFEATDKPNTSSFLSERLVTNQNAALDVPHKYGKVKFTGRIDTKQLVKTYKKYLVKKNKLILSTFEYNKLELDEDHITYASLKAKYVVFAEGYGLKQNPYFNYLPLRGTKGELLTIKAPELKESLIIKSSVFIIPLGDDLYRIGATYNREDKTNTPTTAAKQELLQKLRTFLKCNFEVVEHVAGIRPTVADRRPLVGQHPKHQSLFVLNGFGSRGVLIAPQMAKMLFDYIEFNTPLSSEIDINRFKKHYTA